MTERKESNLVTHTRRELELAGLFDKGSDYNGKIGNAIMELVNVYNKQGHSGESAAMTVHLFSKVAIGENITPITNNPKEWQKVDNNLYQCRRNHSLFSNDLSVGYWHVDDNDKKIIKFEKE